MHFTEQTDQPAVFSKMQVVIMEWIILQEYRNGGGRGGRTSLASMLDCLFVCLSLFLFFSVCLVIHSLFLPHLREQLKRGWNIILHYPFVFLCVCLFNVHLLYDHLYAGREKCSKAIAVGLLRCRMTTNSYGATTVSYTHLTLPTRRTV